MHDVLSFRFAEERAALQAQVGGAVNPPAAAAVGAEAATAPSTTAADLEEAHEVSCMGSLGLFPALHITDAHAFSLSICDPMQRIRVLEEEVEEYAANINRLTLREREARDEVRDSGWPPVVDVVYSPVAAAAVATHTPPHTGGRDPRAAGAGRGVLPGGTPHQAHGLRKLRGGV